MKIFLFVVTLLLLTGCNETNESQTPAINAISQQSESNEEKAVYFTQECSIFRDTSCVNGDEEVTLFPSYSYYDSLNKEWVVQVRGWIYELDYSTLTRSVFVNLLETVMGNIDEEPTFFNKRIELFLSDNESDELLNIQLGDKLIAVGESQNDGSFSADIRITNEEMNHLLDENSRIQYRMVLPKDDKRLLVGEVIVVPKNGRMIVSDIDDTIKISEVFLGEEILLQNTFLNKSRIAPGMLKLFQGFAQDENNTFHYLSGSPRQLITFLTGYISDSGFSMGSMHLKPLQLNLFSSSIYSFLDSDSTYNHKRNTLVQMMQNLPNKQFILIGDSGEKDPEVYSSLLDEYSKQIESIYIRNVSDENATSERMQNLFGEYVNQVKFIDPEGIESNPKL